MMQFRRWCIGAAVVVAGLVSPALGALDLDAAHKSMEGAKGDDAIKVRNDILTDAPKTSAVALDAYGVKVRDKFRDLLTSANKDAALNTGILFAELNTISCDSPLMEMVKTSGNDAMRYWGAKGLADLMPLLVKVGAARVVTTLQTAGATEKSMPVEREIVRALSQSGDSGALLVSLSQLAGLMQASSPDRLSLSAATSGLAALEGAVATATPAVKADAAKAAALLTSYVAQWQAEQSSGAAIAEFARAIEAGVKVLNAASGKKFAVDTKGTAANMLSDVNVITGTDGKGGDLQKAMAGIPVPAAIKKE